MTPLTMNSPRVRRFLTPLLAASLALPVFAQVAPTKEPEKKTDEKAIQLSPFVVNTTKDTGYFAANTLMGSRLNSNLADLAASITVVTKQQLDDTGALDINDVFLYEANTEGAGTYTPSNLSRGLMRDSIAGWNNDTDSAPQTIATANRVRGLGSADTAQNNYPTIQRLAFDSYNTNSVEISRGPNSMLFGTGGASGIINQSTGEAVLGKRHTQVQLRGGSFDAWRASFNTNIPVGDKIAIYLAGLYDSRGFERKPSSDVYRRQYAAITFKPFRQTKLTGSYEHYDNYNNRPNYAMPIDYVSEWRAAGKPGWNPATQMITFANGTTKGPYLIDTRDGRFISTAVTPVGDGAIENYNNGNPGPLYIPSLTLLNTQGGVANRPRIRYDNGIIYDYWVNSALTGGGATTAPLNVYAAPAVGARTQAQWIAASARYMSTRGLQVPTPPASTGATTYGSWADVAVTDKSIYDWEKYNIQGANYGRQTAETMNLELDQEILPNLTFKAGWFRQEMEELTHYGQGQANDAVRLFVDPNTNLLDGRPNPYFGSAFLQDWQSDDFYRPESNDNLRAMLAYTLDLTNNSGWTKFLGHHQFLALASQQKTWNNNLRYRLSNDGGDPRFLPTAASLAAAGNSRTNWAGNAAAVARYYYVGTGGAGTVMRGITAITAPGPIPALGGMAQGGTSLTSMNYYDWVSQSYKTTDMSYDHNLFYAGGGFGITTKKTTSSSFAWQGWLWDERIIPTFGFRRDSLKIRVNNRTGLTNENLYTGGFGNPDYWGILGDPVPFSGDTKTTGGVVRLFKGWSSIDHMAEQGNFWADALRNLSFHYNKSDNFNAPTTLQSDFFGKQLPLPSGKGTDYGIGAALFDNKLVIRLNWYTASNVNAPSAAGSTPTGRTVRIDTQSGRDWAREVVRIRNGQNPSDPNFDNNTIFPLTSAQQDQIAALQGLPFTWPDGRNIQSTESNKSNGKELEVTYNPLRNWTMKLTVGQQRASYSDSIGELDSWIRYRKPQWQALVAPDLAPQYIRSNGNVLRLQSYWTGTGFSSDATSNATGPTGTLATPEATYNSIVVPEYYRLIGLENTNSPNLREWSSSFLTNYAFNGGLLKGVSIGGSSRWSSRAVAGYYGLEDPSTYSHPTPTQSAIVFPDLKRPIYTPAEYSFDFWVSYSRKIFSDKVGLKVQLNVRDAFENGGLIATQFNPDGTAAGFRIKDPRQWFVTTTFDF